MRFDVPALWLIYAAGAALAVVLARRVVGEIPRRFALALALLPLLLTGKAMLRGELYGPSDLYRTAEPWRRLAGPPVANPILSDLAFANLPWRAAVREALANGRAPLWNRFVLGGNPLLGTGQAGVLHPATWLGIALPVALSFTFSCTFTLFLALLSAFLFFRDFRLSSRAALLGAMGWGFSTYVVFWVGWSVGPSTATFPLLLLGLRRLARSPSRAAIALTAAALCLSFCGGHPESFFHGVAAGGVYFLWELFPRRGTRAARSIAAAAGAGLLALLLCGPQLFPLLEAIPNSAEYRLRRDAASRGAAKQSVPTAEAARRLLPDVLPFAHGIYGKSPVDARRDQASGMPLGYAGAVLFPLAALALLEQRPAERGRAIFLAFFLAGLAYGASVPGLLDATARLPGFSLALNYRLVFLAGLGLSGLAAFGLQAVCDAASARRLAVAAFAAAAVIGVIFILARPAFASRALPEGFLHRGLLFEAGPLLLLGVCAVLARGRPVVLAEAALVSLVLQRFLEMRGTYPTLPAGSLAPPLPTLAAIPLGSDPARVVAVGTTFRPNASAFYRLEDVRGYESLVLDRFADTFPLWCAEQHASFNRVDELSRPFLSLLNARWAIGAADQATPAGWNEQARGPELAVFENPRALPRAFAPKNLHRGDPRLRLEEMEREADFARTAWLSGTGPAREENGEARVAARGAGPDLVLTVDAASRVFVATSLPDWPGWVAEEGGARLPVETVNHAFVGLWLPPGRHTVRLSYRPFSWRLGLGTFAAGALAAAALATAKRRPS
jgi:Bacterial membrane protein YfhO